MTAIKNDCSIEKALFTFSLSLFYFYSDFATHVVFGSVRKRLESVFLALEKRPCTFASRKDEMKELQVVSSTQNAQSEG